MAHIQYPDKLIKLYKDAYIYIYIYVKAPDNRVVNKNSVIIGSFWLVVRIVDMAAYITNDIIA